jgi:ferredoxin
MKVWIDQDLCTGDAQCVDICPDVFFMHEDESGYRSYVRDVGGQLVALTGNPS